MRRFAEDTSVSPERSRSEIEATLKRYGADAFGFGTDGSRSFVQFRAHNKQIRFLVTAPDRSSKEIRLHKSGYLRTERQIKDATDQAVRQRWRALLLVVKAKLEAVASGITTFEEEFMAHIVLPDGRTAGQAILPAIDTAYKNGALPRLSFLGLPAPTETIEGEVED